MACEVCSELLQTADQAQRNLSEHLRLRHDVGRAHAPRNRREVAEAVVIHHNLDELAVLELVIGRVIVGGQYELELLPPDATLKDLIGWCAAQRQLQRG